MKKQTTLLLAILLAAGLTSSRGQDTWTQKADFGGTARLEAAAFSIDSKGYMGTGIDGDYRKDFWKYDPVTNAWTQRADFGGTGRSGAVGFSIGSKGYIGIGGDSNNAFLNDFWVYTPDGGGGGLDLTSAASRRTQGGETFDISLPLSGTSGVEPRRGANEFIIFTFSNNVTAVDGTTSNCGTVVRRRLTAATPVTSSCEATEPATSRMSYSP